VNRELGTLSSSCFQASPKEMNIVSKLEESYRNGLKNTSRLEEKVSVPFGKQDSIYSPISFPKTAGGQHSLAIQEPALQLFKKMVRSKKSSQPVG
jgi:hypothetical protein